MIKRQILTILISGGIALALIVLYATVIAPLLKTEVKAPEPIELIDGEIHASDVTRVYLFAPVSREQMKRIEVYNEHGTYAFVRKNGKFVIEKKEEAPYDLTALSYLVTSTGSSVALRRYIIDENTDLSDYGLAASDDPAYFKIITEDDVIHKVWVGDKIPTGGGYYCQYDGRDVIYVLGQNLGLTVFSDVHELITPTIGLPVDQSAYSEVDDLTLIKDGKPVFVINTLSPEENGTDKTDSPVYSYVFKGDSLSDFTPDSSVFGYVIQTLSGLTGTETVAVGDAVDEKLLADEYGIILNDPHYCISYTYGGERATIYISVPDGEGNCYAYSTVYNIVVRLNTKSSEAVKYLYNLGAHDFVQKYIISLNIALASKLEISGSIADEGISVNNSYGIKTDSNNVQTVWNIDTGKYYDVDGVRNFKEIYIDLVFIQIEGEISTENIIGSESLAKVILTDTDGKAMEYEFFTYSGTRCYFTINGRMNDSYAFYVNRDAVEALIRDVQVFEQGYTLDPGI